MARKRTPGRSKRANRSKPTNPDVANTDRHQTEEDLLGPPPREATIIRTDLEREQEEHYAEMTSTSPELAGGDVDADWERAADVGEEAVGGSVATPDKSVVDELGKALGVPQGPDEPVRTSQEILEKRDQHRWEQER